MKSSFVIVGAGLAGAKAAETLRAEGFDGRVVLIGNEGERPYERPPLSKNLLLGTAERESIFVHTADWYAEHDVELRTDTEVVALDRAGRRVRLADGSDERYDKLLIATGASPRRLPVPGAELDTVLSLRTVGDSDRISEALVDGREIVIIGAGWIGLEVAAAARERGATVTVVEAAELPLQRVLGEDMGAMFEELHRERGVSFELNARVTGLGGGTESAVVLADGTVLRADTVIVAVGVRPNVELAESAGLPVDDGILVDEHWRTADPDVFAAGDVANFDHPLLGSRVRVEHWSNALHSGPAAARAMLGRPASYDRLPYFYTDQYDLGMEYAGRVSFTGAEQVVIRGERGKREFVAFWVEDGRVVAGMNVNVWDVQDQIQQLVRAGLAGRTVDLARLADPTTPMPDAL